MNMSIFDWAIIAGVLVFLVIAAQYTRKYATSVPNFLAAGRCAGRYLIAVAGGIAGWGAISAVGDFEKHLKAGFSIQWWFLLLFVANLVASISGWMIYRFRQARCLTAPQFFEQRYSRRFRIYAGFLCWLSGIMNFGLFPAVGAKFFIFFCGLPPTFIVAGITVSTFVAVMLLLLGISLYFLFIGGQIAVIVTDFLQGIICNVCFIIFIVALFFIFRWSQVTEALSNVPVGESMFHPFQASQTKDFNAWFYIIVAISLFYTWVIGGGAQGYDVSAKNPHEARMGRVINYWRAVGQQLAIILIPIAAFTVMHHPDFAIQAEKAKTIIAEIAGRNAQETSALQGQATTPVALAMVLGKGLMGVLCAIMLCAFITTHDTYMQAWGSIFIQDVVLPFRKKPLTAQQHIKLLRFSIFGVALFIFLFGWLYRQNEYILMFMAFTGTIYSAGAGISMIGGLYWKRGTTAAAWTAMTLGLIMAFAGAFARRIWPEFPLNSQWVYFIAMITCTSLYIIISLCGRKVCDMDKLLHRGKYAVAEDDATVEQAPVRGFRALIAMGREFTFWDKVIYLGSVGWTLFLCAVFIVGTVYNWIVDVKTESWTKFWWIYILINFAISILALIWFFFGGLRDYREMFRLLRTRKADELDDGRVIEKI